MMMDWLMLAVGLAMLAVSGDFLVRGASALAARFGVPAFIISLTIMGFGTSAPELVIASNAAYNGVADLALGLVIGSNIANILVILTLPALFGTIRPGGTEARVEYYYMLAATVLLSVLTWTGGVYWWASPILLGGLALLIRHAIREGKRHRDELAKKRLAASGPEAGGESHTPLWRATVYIVGSLVALPFGADILVESASAIARDFGVTEAVIGLTLVAVGTSAPELATTFVAMIRRQADVAMGNIIGSNAFNILGVLGVAALFGPIPADPSLGYVSVPAMLVATLMLIPFVFFRRDINWKATVIFLSAYAAYVFAVLETT